jgi:hypothetical protein
MLRPTLAAIAVLLAFAPATSASAWGYQGHEVIAALARGYLTPAVRAKVDALLAADPDPLTAPDMLARATWADAWRSAGHRETAPWHFVDIELDHPDVAGACFGFPASSQPASAGPENDCVIDRLDAFTRELADPATSQREKILALKYVLHFVGDLHQPLHAADNHDRGGNCVPLALGGARTVNLHSYWDSGVVAPLGGDPAAAAAQLQARITRAQKAQWERGDAASWAQEAYAVARTTAYWPGLAGGCAPDRAPVSLPSGYEARAEAAAALQLERAGVRLALVLNRALGAAGAS